MTDDQIPDVHSTLVKSEQNERRYQILLTNELIAKDDQIASFIRDNAIYAEFAKGTKIIAQGNDDDCVYFILSGEVDVFIDGQFIDKRTVPFTVGELAAKIAGKPRTADVVVSSNPLKTLVLPGTKFREVIQLFPRFKANLEEAIDTLSREKIAQLGQHQPSKRLSWVKISSGVSIILGVVAMIFSGAYGLTLFQIGLAGFFSMIMLFVAMLLLNPELRYRNMFSVSGAGIVVLALYGSVSWVLTIGSPGQKIPFVLDFSSDAEQKIAGVIAAFLALLALAGLSAFFDFKLTSRDDK